MSNGMRCMYALVCVCVCEDTGKGKCSLAAKLNSRLEQTFLFSRAYTTVL